MRAPAVLAPLTAGVLAVVLAAAAAPAAAAPPQVRVAWPAAAGAVVRPGQVLEVRVRVSGGPRRRTPLADVALLSLARSGRPLDALVRRRVRSGTVRVRVPARAAGPVRLRVRAAERVRSRRFRVAAAVAPGTPDGAPARPPAAPGPACDATTGSALTAAGAPAAARPGEIVGMLVSNTGATCLTGGICPGLEAQAPDGSWVEGLDEERVCPAIAVILAPGESRRFELLLPADQPPGSLYRLILDLAGPEVSLEATTPVEVLP